jgi:hypothetical protein
MVERWKPGAITRIYFDASAALVAVDFLYRKAEV